MQSATVLVLYVAKQGQGRRGKLALINDRTFKTRSAAREGGVQGGWDRVQEGQSTGGRRDRRAAGQEGGGTGGREGHEGVHEGGGTGS